MHSLISSVISLLFLLHTPPALAGQMWYPYPVEVWKTQSDSSSYRVDTLYTPLEQSSEPWNICVSFPHMKDTYWLAVNFGISEEIQRLNGTMQLYQAGGYGNLATQILQIRECAARGADGIIVGSISFNGLNDLVAELQSMNIPVVDAINGISSSKVAAKSLVSFKEMGFKAGEYIVQNHMENEGPIRIAWFPGPLGAGWVTAGNEGFISAAKDSQLVILETRYGDTGANVQARLINEVLSRHGDKLDYIVGTGVTAEAAVRILRKKRLNKKIKIVSYYLTPGVYQGIKRGTILASLTDSAVIQGRIAVDQMVRILEGKVYNKHVSPQLIVIDKKNIGSVDRKSMLAPSGFQATYTVNRNSLRK